MNEQKSWYPTPVQRSMLDFMKEQQPQLYAELKAEGKLQEHLRNYSHWYHDKVDMITEQMGGTANAVSHRSCEIPEAQGKQVFIARSLRHNMQLRHLGY